MAFLASAGVVGGQSPPTTPTTQWRTIQGRSLGLRVSKKSKFRLGCQRGSLHEYGRKLSVIGPGPFSELRLAFILTFRKSGLTIIASKGTVHE